MNLKPEQIPDEAWRVADRAYELAVIGGKSHNDAWRIAISSCIGLVLGEPIAWRHKPTGVVYRVSVDDKCEPLYALPAQDTPNADQ